MISDQNCRLFLNIKALTFFDKKNCDLWQITVLFKLNHIKNGNSLSNFPINNALFL